MNGEFIKADFENVFLAAEGEPFTLEHTGEPLQGILTGNKIQCRAESSIKVDDVLISALRAKSYRVLSTDYEVVGGVRTCLNLLVAPH